jgi:WD40 repeat protein
VLSFNPDGTLLAMAGSITSSLTVWDVATGAVVINDSPGADELREVEFSPDGTALLVGTFTELIVLSTEDWSIVETRRWNEEEGDAPSRGLHYSSDGARIVAAIDGAPTVLVLDATTLETMSTVPETHAGALLGLDVSSDDQLVATVGVDGFARVWELDTGALLSEIPIDLANGAGNVAFINDDRQLMVTARRGPVKIVTIDTGDLIALARSRVTRGFTPSECDQYQLDPCPTREQIRER